MSGKLSQAQKNCEEKESNNNNNILTVDNSNIKEEDNNKLVAYKNNSKEGNGDNKFKVYGNNESKIKNGSNNNDANLGDRVGNNNGDNILINQKGKITDKNCKKEKSTKMYGKELVVVCAVSIGIFPIVWLVVHSYMKNYYS